MSSIHEQNNNCDSNMHVATTEIEALKEALLEKQSQLIAMETACLRESDRQVELEDSVIAWQDKYDRLYESHKRVQKVNQSLEDKLLKLVDRNTAERAQLTSDVATLSVRLAQANYNIAKLQREIERYKADINLAIQLLQCKPDSFVPQKVSSLPNDIQSKVSSYMRLETNSHSDSEGSNSGVGVATSNSYSVLPASDSPPPLCPFPPTAMAYSMRGLDASSNKSSSTVNMKNKNNIANSSARSCERTNNNNNNNNISNNNSVPTILTSKMCSTATVTPNNSDREMISPSVVAKFLEDELKASEVKHCDTCQCSSKDLTVLADVSHSYTVSTQTPYQTNGNNIGGGGVASEPISSLCVRCNSNLNSPSRTNSPYLLKLVKSSDSVISETKSSVSDINDVDKLFTPAKRDDLMVNPILGHHRLCDRTNNHKNNANTMVTGNKFSSMMFSTAHLPNLQNLSYASDTATKYILETSNSRKFVDSERATAITDIFDLKKYNDDVVKSSVKIEEELSEINAAEEVEDEAKPLLGSSALDEKDDMPTIGREKRHNGPKVANLLETGASGSVSSLWSRTSSCEGAKMFENFNRNLIKTIKAENPRYRGPRLCSMRIQHDGQNNILFDNLESIEPSPIVYTRREKFLDEELTDAKDVITSDISMSAASKTEFCEMFTLTDNEHKRSTDVSDFEMLNQKLLTDYCDTGGGGTKLEITEKTADDDADSGTDVNVNVPSQQPSLNSQIGSCNNQSSREREITNTFLEQQFKNLVVSEQQQQQQQQQLLKTSFNYDMMHLNDSSCKNSQNSKSRTQSSSISDTIEFQESVMLRRQQLSRVAEWVKKNSQIEQQQQQQQQQQQLQQQQQQQITNVILGNSTTLAESADHQTSMNSLDQFDSVSVEKLSTDSGYKTTPQLCQAGNGPNADSNSHRPSCTSLLTANLNTITQYPFNKEPSRNLSNTNSKSYYNNSNNNNNSNYSNTYFARTSRSGIITTQTIPVSISNETNLPTATIVHHQPNCDILNYKYYPSDSDQSQPLQAELHTSRQNVDIAQMEYNVKQFLLKQNEWSMRSSRRTTATATAAATTPTTTTTTSSSNESSTPPLQTRQALNVSSTTTTSRNTLRQSKLFNGSANIGPGIGERVVCSGLRINPHRTETNL